MAKVAKEKSTTEVPQGTYWQKLESEVASNQSRVSMILGGLIILVTGFLIFNFFNKEKSPNLGPAQNTESIQEDVAPESLPGTYTVKEGDTLFTIAQKYYNDGYKFNLIADANKLSNPNSIGKGQVLTIPKIEVLSQMEASKEATFNEIKAPLGSKGEMVIESSQTIWGEKIEGSTYTVVKGDWLSKIAGRAYGDIFAYGKIAKANSITNPNLIEPGMILVIPR